MQRTDRRLALCLALALTACGGDPPGGTMFLWAQVEGLEAEPHNRFKSFLEVTWGQGEAVDLGWVEYRLADEEDWRATPKLPRVRGWHQQLVVGLPYDADVVWRVANDFGKKRGGVVYSDEMESSTGSMPSDAYDFLIPELNASEPGRWTPDSPYLLGSLNQRAGGWTGGDYWKFIIDRDGTVLWAWLTKDNAWSIYLRRAVDGTHIVWDDATAWSNFDGGAQSVIHRTYLDGKEIETIPAPGLHHAFTELPDGSLVYGAQMREGEGLRKITPDGDNVVLWECLPWQVSIGGPDNYCESNSLWWSEARDTFLYSFYTSSSVLEIDHGSGDVLRYWGHLPGAWAFSPPESAFFFQHGATYTPDGNLLLSSHRSNVDFEGVVREYKVRGGTQTLEEVWNSGIGMGIDSPTAGEAHRLPNGNTLHNFGASPVVQEIAPDGEVVWEVAWEENRLIGRTIFLDDLYALLENGGATVLAEDE